MSNWYYFKTLEKCTAGMLDLFNEIYVNKWTYNKTNSEWSQVQKVVPIEISTKDNIVRGFEIGSLSGTVKTFPTVPRMSMMLNDLSKDELRQKSLMNQYKEKSISNGGEIIYLDNPTWWIASYTLFIMSRRMDDMTQILEQTLPKFQPNLSLNIKLIPEVGMNISLPVTMDGSAAFDIIDEIDAGTTRMILSELTFTVPIPLFPPITQGKIINKIVTNFGTIASDSDGSTVYQIQESFNIYAHKIEMEMEFDMEVGIVVEEPEDPEPEPEPDPEDPEPEPED